MGTFDDLSDEEKTRALLQFLQHHQQLERENENKPFENSISSTASISIRGTINHSLKNYLSFGIVFSASSSSILLKYLVHNPFRQIGANF